LWRIGCFQILFKPLFWRQNLKIDDNGIMTTISKDEAAVPPENNLYGFVICQILGLAALALIIYSVNGNDYRLLKYTAFLALATLVIPKPNFMPYFFVLSFFTMLRVFSKGWMLVVHVTDAIFVLLVLVFLSNKKIDVKAAFEKQRFLMVSLVVFVLWAAFGYLVNFYAHTELENVTSLFFIFNFVEMAVMVILLSQPQWKEHRDKLILFYVMCSFCEIVIAVSLEVLGGARTFADFHKFTGTLGSHHAMMGNVMVLSFGVASCAFFELRGKHERLFSLCVAFLSVATILLSGTRSAFLGILLAVPVFILLQVRRKRIGGVMLLIVAVVLIFAMLKASSIKAIMIQSLVGSGSDADMSSYGRILIWERVYEHALHGPWLQKIAGIGVGTFNSLKFNYFLEVGTFTTGAHNNFLHVFVEAGIVGFVIFCAVFIGIIWKLVLKSRCNDNTARCFLLCTLILLFSGLTQETFWFNPVFGRFWLQYMFFYLIIFNFRAERHDEMTNRKTGF
jgi:O-antigen ligase